MVGLMPLVLGPRFGTCICPFLIILFLPKFAINVTILILKLSIFRFCMLMFFALHPVGVLLLSLSGLLGRLAVLVALHQKWAVGLEAS